MNISKFITTVLTTGFYTSIIWANFLWGNLMWVSKPTDGMLFWALTTIVGIIALVIVTVVFILTNWDN